MPCRAYRLPKANIALEGNIANHARDLYRCVFSVKDNTLNERAFVCQKQWDTTLIFVVNEGFCKVFVGVCGVV